MSALIFIALLQADLAILERVPPLEVCRVAYVEACQRHGFIMRAMSVAGQTWALQQQEAEAAVQKRIWFLYWTIAQHEKHKLHWLHILQKEFP